MVAQSFHKSLSLPNCLRFGQKGDENQNFVLGLWPNPGRNSVDLSLDSPNQAPVSSLIFVIYIL